TSSIRSTSFASSISKVDGDAPCTSMVIAIMPSGARNSSTRPAAWPHHSLLAAVNGSSGLRDALRRFASPISHLFRAGCHPSLVRPRCTALAITTGNERTCAIAARHDHVAWIPQETQRSRKLSSPMRYGQTPGGQASACDSAHGRQCRLQSLGAHPARPQCVPDHPFVSANTGLNQRTPVVAGCLLPGHSVAFGNEL